jgi:hypothetical protein
MKLQRRSFLHLATGAVALPALSRCARAQAFPTRPITIVVPFPAGGALDVLGRILAERMRTSLGQSIIADAAARASDIFDDQAYQRVAPVARAFVPPRHGRVRCLGPPANAANTRTLRPLAFVRELRWVQKSGFSAIGTLEYVPGYH